MKCRSVDRSLKIRLEFFVRAFDNFRLQFRASDGSKQITKCGATIQFSLFVYRLLCVSRALRSQKKKMRKKEEEEKVVKK